ncbi:MAG: ComEC family competence protein [Chitinophagaceae bacterium]|nr:ComEC family competence protein [Chitinophagaceae bacterium]
MSFTPIPVWKEAPFLRLLIPFVFGILAQKNFQWTVLQACTGISISIIGLLLFSFKNIDEQFRRYWIYGFLLHTTLFFAGALVMFLKDASKNANCITRVYTDSAILIAKLEEPLAEKAKSFKTIASVETIETKNSSHQATGKIIIYFQKDSSITTYHAGGSHPGYGSRIVFKKRLQPIKNTGNPGSFNYREYCSFQQIYYQVYLKPEEYQILNGKTINHFRQFLFDVRKSIVNILRSNIPGHKEAGLAEALLIGYKDDLDKDLIQSYSNTGVVHIIAISGLHVGLIYWILARLLHLLTKRKKILWLKAVLIVAGLWLFSLLAGGSPSVLRSAVMFTFIILGESISRKISVYNSLSASAFLLLAYNPFWLWDVGFQLSYAAVLSIIIFMKPFYNWWFIRNKILDTIWKLNAVTLAAQVLTTPICLYYFHQFPTLFFITNLIAVPLSSIILLGELLLCVVFPLQEISKIIGWLLYWSIRLMNTFIERIDSLPFSTWENIQIDILQLFFLYMTIISISVWLLNVKKLACIVALSGVLLFGIHRIHSNMLITDRHRLIVYNIPLHQSIDFIEGRNYWFQGDSIVLTDDILQNFHLKPARIAQQIRRADSLPDLFNDGRCFLFVSKKIILVEKPLTRISGSAKISTDIIIISKNPQISISEIAVIFNCKKIIFDASNVSWKIEKWKTDCEKFNIPYYSVPEKGAFVMNMN